jgi:hypothetical protein
MSGFSQCPCLHKECQLEGECQMANRNLEGGYIPLEIDRFALLPLVGQF